MKRLILNLFAVMVTLSTVLSCSSVTNKTIANKEVLAPYIADSAELAYERMVMDDSVSQFVCNHTQYLLPEGSWKHEKLIGALVDYYNLNEIDHAVRTDIDAYQRYVVGAEKVGLAIAKVDVGIICNDSLRDEWSKLISLFVDVYAQGDSAVLTYEEDEPYVDYEKPIFSKANVQYDRVVEMFHRHFDYLEKSLDVERMPDADSVSPARWLPGIYTDYVGQEAEATDEQWAVLYEQAMSEQDFDTKATLFFALMCMNAPFDQQVNVMSEAEKMMEQGVYSPILDLLWRAYRVCYGHHYGCPSTWCYSANLCYNYYRRIVAVTMLQYIDDHPDDHFALLKFLTHAGRDNIMRLGEYMFGNEAATEHMCIYWGEAIL